MTGNEKQRYDMLVRVRDFGRTHGDRFPMSTVGGKALATVDAVVNTLHPHAAPPFSPRRGPRGGAGAGTAAHEALAGALNAIARTARAVELDTPGVEDRFRVPGGQSKLALVTLARAFARDVDPVASQFIEYGMPADFVAQLTARIADFEQALEAQEAGRERYASVRASIRASLEEAMVAVQRLDAIVPNVLGGDESAMATWEVARLIDQSGIKRAAARAVPVRSDPAVPPPVIPTTTGAPQPVGA